MQQSLIQWAVYKATEKQLTPRELLRVRKIVYIALIILLFAGAFLWRTYVVDAKANELALRETNRGEVDLTSAALTRSLLGSRGLLTCYLWTTAMDQQKKNQWNDLEQTVRILTKLQPHYITPWLFQSWNLAYNVSVESDRPTDKYYFVARGIGLLAEGERQNLNNPDLRHSIGLYLEHKVGKSDETNVMRSLLQLSMIPPKERDPSRFRTTTADGRQEVNWEEFEKFCKNHPQLCRRLREGIRRETKREQERQFTCREPEDVIQFLTDNLRIPSLYREAEPSRPDELLPVAERFPVLPPPPGLESRRPAPGQRVFDKFALTTDSPLGDDIDVFLITRSWYCYSQEPLPDPSDLPGNSMPFTDRVHQRKPRYMATLIFRDHPAKAQEFHASQGLQQEGWFLDEGWAIPGWFAHQGDKFADGSPAVVGKGVQKWSLEAWRSAANQWREHGENNHLLFRDDVAEANKRRLAKAFADSRGLNPNSPPPPLREEALDEKEREQYHAARYMFELHTYLQMSNFTHHYVRSLVEAKDETVTARRAFYEAETLRLTGSPEQALAKYQEPEALKAWRDKVLLQNRDFRHDDWVQEQSAEIQLRYLGLYNEQNGKQMTRQAAQFFLSQLAPRFGGAVPVGTLQWAPLVLRAQDPDNPILGGPFDMKDDQDVPLVPSATLESVYQRMNPNYTSRAPAPTTPAPVMTRPGVVPPPMP
jgi:hypothetical protein